MWKQTLYPNLETDPNHPLYVYQDGQLLTDWYGWCLAVVAAAFGAKGSSYSAKTAWASCQNKHYGRDIPEGVYTPIWYAGGDYGHVVIGYRKGNNITIYSSPYTHKATFERFDGELNDTIDRVGQIYGVGKMSGWSGTVLDTWIMEWVEKPKDEPKPEPEPDPEPIEDNNGKDEDMTTPDPVTPVDQQLVGGIMEEAGEWFDFSKTVKLIAYLIGDAFLVGAILVPDIISTIQAPDLTIFGEYLAKVLLEAGTCILMVFKLIKKKS